MVFTSIAAAKIRDRFLTPDMLCVRMCQAEVSYNAMTGDMTKTVFPTYAETGNVFADYHSVPWTKW